MIAGFPIVCPDKRTNDVCQLKIKTHDAKSQTVYYECAECGCHGSATSGTYRMAGTDVHTLEVVLVRDTVH